MSFTFDIRLELARAQEEKCDTALSELCGFVLASAAVSIAGLGRYSLSLESELQPIIERLHAMLKRLFSIDCAMRMAHTDRLGGKLRYALVPEPGEARAILDALGLLDEAAPFGLRALPEARLIEPDVNRRALLRGAFLATGSAVNPEKAYAVELALGGEELARFLAAVLHSYQLPARIAPRKAQFVVYLKGAEGMSDFLALLGAGKAVLTLENVRVMKGVRNDVNRQVNCDQNNLDKVVAAAEKQLSVIHAIDRRLGLAALPDNLREIAELRLQYPDAALSDLGVMASPAIGKSGVNARMRKLEAIAEELVNE